jgi:hypothetical protein
MTEARRSQTAGTWNKAIQAARRSLPPRLSPTGSGRRRAHRCWVQLVGGRAGLAWLAERALDAATEIHLAVDEGDRAARGRQARLALQDFLMAASGDVGEPAAGSEDADLSGP